MTSTKPIMPTSHEKTPRKKHNYQPNTLSPQEKVQAVLAVWTERCKPAVVCRQLNVNWITFNQWQQRAMEGMLHALENRVNLAKGEALSPRLQLRQVLKDWTARSDLPPSKKTRNDPPDPASTRRAETADGAALAPTLSHRALRQRHALASPAAPGATPLPAAGSQEIRAAGLGRVLPAPQWLGARPASLAGRWQTL